MNGNNREASLAALKAIRAEIAKAEGLRLKSRKEKQTPAPEKAEPTKEE
jgi:hypothetical protein